MKILLICACLYEYGIIQFLSSIIFFLFAMNKKWIFEHVLKIYCNVDVKFFNVKKEIKNIKNNII